LPRSLERYRHHRHLHSFPTRRSSDLGLLIGACSDSDDTVPQGENPLEGLHLLESIQANGHTLEIYSKKEAFVTGYNELFLRIKEDRKSTRLNSSHVKISYAVFCLKKK